jgi:hypothetical protein
LRFHSTGEQAEKIARRITGWLLIALAAYIAVVSLYTLIAAEAKPQLSYVWNRPSRCCSGRHALAGSSQAETGCHSEEFFITS